MSSETIIQEVDEELRRDRIRKLWRQVAPFVLGGAIGVVLLVAGYEGWTYWQKSQSAKSADLFYAATKIADGTDVDAAKKALDDVIAQGSGGYPALAQFRQAALLAQSGKPDEALAAYDSLATSLPNTSLRELALVLAANLLIDKGDVAAVQQRVQGSLTPESPLRNAAREVLGLTQYKAGQLDEAIKTFNDVVTDPSTSSDIGTRIQTYIQQLIAEGAKPVVASSEAPATDASASASTEASASVAPAASASTAVDASTELDVAPSSEAAASSASAAPSASSAAPEVSSSAP